MSLEAKSVSLNDLIAAEKQASHPSTIHPEYSATNLPLVQLSTRTQTQRHKKSSDIDEGKKISPLKGKLRKTFQLKSPLTPKKLKYLQKPSYKRKNLTTKREIQGSNVKINQKYIPLLRNIGLLFDNILSSGSSETNEFRRRKYKRNPFANKKDNICTCASKDINEHSHAQEETVTYTSDSNEIKNTLHTATPPADNTIYDNVGRFRRNKNVPVLLARNPPSLRRNNSRLSERSGPAYNRCFEGHIAGDNGNNECSTGNGKNASNSQDYEENTDSHSRNDAGSLGSAGEVRGIGINTQTSKIDGKTGENNTSILPADKTSEDVTGVISEHEGQVKSQVRRNETEGPIFLPKFTSGLQGKNSWEENIPKRNTEDYEKSIPNNISNDKRITVRNGQITTENKKIRRANETLGPKVVMIFDGYSVARDVNGENKMTERAIHIHS